jgi:3-oxoacyl-[acyl-carrier protein] reductase
MTDRGTLIVTGAAAGIGRAIACALATDWPRIALVDLDAARLDDSVAAVREAGAEAAVFCADLAQANAADSVVDAVRRRFGPIGGLVNNAGILKQVPLSDTDCADFDLTVAVNLRAPHLLIRSVAPDMIAAGMGAIVSLGSSAGKTGGSSSQGVYGMSKAGVICLTKSWARALAPHGIRVNSVSPALIATDMIRGLEQFASAVPLGRLGQPGEVAEAVAFLMSDRAGFITGEDIDVNGGFLMD